MRIPRIALASLALCALSVTSFAQDECITAVPIFDGFNGTFTNTTATQSVEPWSCGSATLGYDLWYLYTATGTGTTKIETCGGATNFDTRIAVYDGSCGALNELICNDDACGLQSIVEFSTTEGTTYIVRVAGFSTAQGDFDLNVTPARPVLEGVGESTLNAGNLSTTAVQNLLDGYYVRWSLTDPSGLTAGIPGTVCLNIGIGGSPGIGSNPIVPEFIQLSDFSTPLGFGLFLPPNTVASGDFFIGPLPPGILFATDVLRLQGLVVNPTLATISATNVIEFVHSFNTCVVFENFDSISSGYPAGWANGGGVAEWTVDANGTTSGGTGPTSAVSVPNYMYCETSSPRQLGDTFIMNTAPVPSSSLSANVLKFQLSRVGATIGTLEVRMDDGSGTFPTLLATYTGPEPGGLEWTLESIPLPTPLPANVQIQFHYSRGSSFTGDIAIDDFCLE